MTSFPSSAAAATGVVGRCAQRRAPARPHHPEPAPPETRELENLMAIDPTTHNHAADPAVSFILTSIASDLNEMNDGDDAPFGLYADFTTDGNTMTVKPDTDAEHYDGEDLEEMLVDGEPPTTPVVRITVERIA